MYMVIETGDWLSAICCLSVSIIPFQCPISVLVFYVFST